MGEVGEEERSCLCLLSVQRIYITYLKCLSREKAQVLLPEALLRKFTRLKFCISLEEVLRFAFPVVVFNF